MPIRPYRAGQPFDPDTSNNTSLTLEEREIERWRIAAQIVEKMKMAGFGCQLPIPVTKSQ
jgi:hypothetical protein